MTNKYIDYLNSKHPTDDTRNARNRSRAEDPFWKSAAGQWALRKQEIDNGELLDEDWLECGFGTQI